MHNHHQTAYVTQPGQLTKTELNDLIRNTGKPIAPTQRISRTQARKECLRRASVYKKISGYSGSAIIACLAFVVLVQLIE